MKSQKWIERWWMLYRHYRYLFLKKELCDHPQLLAKSSNRSLSILVRNQLICRIQKKDHSATVLSTRMMHSIWRSRVFEQKYRRWIVLSSHAKWSSSDQFTMEVCWWSSYLIVFLFQTLIELVYLILIMVQDENTYTLLFFFKKN